jgi:hypothetical protein
MTERRQKMAESHGSVGSVRGTSARGTQNQSAQGAWSQLSHVGAQDWVGGACTGSVAQLVCRLASPGDGPIDPSPSTT